jgi:hypothetical protein
LWARRYLPDRRAQSNSIAERQTVCNPAPMDDILGRTDTNKEDDLFQNRVPDRLRSHMYGAFLASDSSMPPPGYKGKVRCVPLSAHVRVSDAV